MNPFLALLALFAGFIFSWFFIVTKQVRREVPQVLWMPVAPESAPESAWTTEDTEATGDVCVEAGEVSDGAAEEPTHALGRPASSDEDATEDFSVADSDVSQDAAATEDEASQAATEPVPSASEATDPEPAELETADAEAAEPQATEEKPSDAPWAPRDEEPEDTKPFTGEVEDTVEPPIAVRPPKMKLTPMIAAHEDGSAPAEYTVKGDSIAMMYITADSKDFERARPDVWFIDEAAAEAEGYVRFSRPAK